MAKKAKKAAPGPKKVTAFRRVAKTVKTATPAEQAPGQATAPDIPADTIVLERLGKVQTWKMPKNAYAGDKNGRLAFEGGFTLRTQQWAGQEDYSIPERFNPGKLQTAFVDGYREAARQDGDDRKPRALAGSSSGKAPAKGKR